MQRSLLLFSLLLSIALNSVGQITVVADHAIDSLVAKHIRINEEGKGFPGFRVQIFSDSGNGARERANEKRSQFVSKYPEVPIFPDLLF